MRKLILAVLGTGIFTISNAESISATQEISNDDTPEKVIATGTLSIEEMKRAIIKLKQESELQSARISYLEEKLASLKDLTKELTEKKEPAEKEKEPQDLDKNYCVIANLNVRKGPGLKYQVFAWLRKGAVVSGNVRKGKWLKILSPSGWVSSLYLRECDGRKERKEK